jgi:uncharacterized membrane-anchored protein YjiN (DUF445 family)
MALSTKMFHMISDTKSVSKKVAGYALEASYEKLMIKFKKELAKQEKVLIHKINNQNVTTHTKLIEKKVAKITKFKSKTMMRSRYAKAAESKLKSAAGC